MSNYTLQLREYIEGVSDASTTRDRIADARSKLFDFDYPIFDPDYKAVFETHFIRNFYVREIGQETMGLFKFHLETWLQINMPYFNKMFESELLQFNPLHNTSVDTNNSKTNTKTHDMTTGQTVNKDVSGQEIANKDVTNDTDTVVTKDGTVTVDNFDRQLESNNPDSRLAIYSEANSFIEYASRIDENQENNSTTTHDSDTVNTRVVVNDDTITTTNLNDDTTSTINVDGTITDVEEYVYSKTGKIGVQSFSKMVTEYRESLVRIETQIFKEMNQLFMLVY